ncbi:MAG: MFS transporter [Nanoarchaeota archaeon]|nr:MFS transporter [Nanoarchaeota archaeon]
MNIRLKLLILSDILIISSFGLIAPIFAIFINDSLEGGSIVSAGLAMTIFLVVKSSAQLPLSKYLIDKEKHKTRLLLVGTALIISVPFIYVFADHVNTIFIAQAVYGLGTAFAYPCWFSLFITYVDKRHKGFEYAVYSTSVGLGTALSAFLGAKIADALGFKALFFFVGGIAFLGFLLLIILDRIEGKDLRILDRIRKKREREKNRRRVAAEKGIRRKKNR